MWQHCGNITPNFLDLNRAQRAGASSLSAIRRIRLWLSTSLQWYGRGSGICGRGRESRRTHPWRQSSFRRRRMRMMPKGAWMSRWMDGPTTACGVKRMMIIFRRAWPRAGSLGPRLWWDFLCSVTLSFCPSRVRITWKLTHIVCAGQRQGVRTPHPRQG